MNFIIKIIQAFKGTPYNLKIEGFIKKIVDISHCTFLKLKDFRTNFLETYDTVQYKKCVQQYKKCVQQYDFNSTSDYSDKFPFCAF